MDMVLESLGSSLYNALKKFIRASTVDEEAVRELVRDFQRALLKADVNVGLVLELSKRIEDRALREELPPGISRREHTIRVVYEELTRILGEKPAKLEIKPGGRNVIMMVGIQGSGKTTSVAKLARYLQKRGYKVAVVCADTFRPGAYAQLRQLLEGTGIPVYGEERGDAVSVAVRGCEKFRDYEVVIVDTAGRHREEEGLLREMAEMAEAIKPTEIMLVVDATIGQQAASQAEAFHKATGIGSIFLAKLDGSARGGGALSAVAATGAPIKFIGTGEKLEDIEPFDPPRFVGRLLGMGDIEALVRRVREAEVKVSEKDVKAFLTGKFTLQDMYEQMLALRKMGPLRKILGMIPGFAYNIPVEELDVAEEKLRRWGAIIQSMTPEERENPKILNASRVRRIARGSGTSEAEVKELVKQYFAAKKLIKALRGKRMLRMRGRLPRFA